MFYRQDPERWRRRRRDYPGLGNPFIGGLL